MTSEVTAFLLYITAFMFLTQTCANRATTNSQVSIMMTSGSTADKVCMLNVGRCQGMQFSSLSSLPGMYKSVKGSGSSDMVWMA